MALNPSQEKLLSAHHEIDSQAQEARLPFVSGWDTEHHVDYGTLVPVLAGGLTAQDVNSYTSVGDSTALREKIHSFHARVDGIPVRGSGLIIGAGSSPLVCSIMTLMSAMGQKKVLYVKPIYHAYYYMAKMLGIEMQAIGHSMSSISEQEIIGKLPSQESVLLITDPCWISGRSLSSGLWHHLRSWQSRTGSFIIVDGTFQYTRWQAMEPEECSRLDPDLTLRLICPTKSLCVHGFRFAYALLPRRLTGELGWIYTKFAGSNSFFDLAGAHFLMNQLLSPDNNRALAAQLRARYDELRRSGFIEECVTEPDCTYYAFARVNLDLSTVLAMNGDHFELDLPQDYVRVNILSPHLTVGKMPG